MHRYTRRELFRKLGDVITRGSVSALLAADAAERLTWRPSFLGAMAAPGCDPANDLGPPGSVDIASNAHAVNAAAGCPVATDAAPGGACARAAEALANWVR